MAASIMRNAGGIGVNPNGAARDCDIDDSFFALFHWIEQQGTCLLSARHGVSLEDSYSRQLAPVAFETPVMGDAGFLNALPPLKPNATPNTDCEAKT